MRSIAFAFTLALLVPLAPAQDGTGGGAGPGVELAVSSDWERILTMYRQTQGGRERYDSIRTMAFDYVPSRFDAEGEEQLLDKRSVEILYRPDEDEQEVRTVRIEADFSIGAEEKVSTVSLITPEKVEVWLADAEGAYTKTEARELQALVASDAKGLLAQLDLLMWVDSPDLKVSFGGILQREGKRYATVEAAFHPRRAVLEPARLYFSAVTSLIERIDAFDPRSRMRIATTYLEDYQDHGGIKFPQLLRHVDRRRKPVGSWRLTEVKLNPELDRERFLKP